MEPRLTDHEIFHQHPGPSESMARACADAQLRKALWWAQNWIDTNLSEDYGFADAVKGQGIEPWEEA